MTSRLERLRGELEESLLVSNPVNVRYLCGFESTNAVLLVEPDRARLFTDFRYSERARAIEHVEAVETHRNLFADLSERLSGRIAFEADALTFERHSLLADAGIELVPRKGLVESLRVVKDEDEIRAMRRAAEIVSEAFGRFAEEPFVGRSERDLVWRLKKLLHELGAEEVAFPIVVASGETGGSPHAVPGERCVGDGETVVVDAGCRIGGYCSDCTRTFLTGALPDELERAYDVVRRAQEAGVGAVHAGAEGVAVDGVARSLITEAGLGDLFGHGLGHGVGLELHEGPWLHPEFPSTLAAGNVVTVEPGVYFPGRGGIRIEDMVLVGDDAPEVLTSFTKEQVTVR